MCNMYASILLTLHAEKFFMFFVGYRLTVSKNSFRTTIRVHCQSYFVRPDLGQNCLHRLSADDTSRHWTLAGPGPEEAVDHKAAMQLSSSSSYKIKVVKRYVRSKIILGVKLIKSIWKIWNNKWIKNGILFSGGALFTVKTLSWTRKQNKIWPKFEDRKLIEWHSKSIESVIDGIDYGQDVRLNAWLWCIC